ncbi:hypothetical protein A1O3_07088 [Capronia epimyces CBS 606.96]|uniref:Extracellular mutant protein 11 C-terminal domain-containing protein n=1 Tax=Capronia epimyces CBS 606.96 TaxID=1182542 RepID=W9YES5_9EURO|nr:uncharacterized protein A1O3_07088 [Capronia epimyces CBS 606.96]EXJ80804.1 hypothetical protein A1O3_07088 [Capronia epimyces CBS 606.96]
MKQFVQNREGTSAQTLLANRSLTPQPISHRDQATHPHDDVGQIPRAASRDGRHNDTKRHDAVKLKLPVPNTIGKRPSPSDYPPDAGHNVAGHVSTTAHNSSARTVPNMQAPRRPVASAFDDTQSIHFDDSTSIAEDQDGQMNMHVRTGLPRNTPDPLRTTSVQHLYNTYEGHPAAPHEREGAVGRLPDWQATVDAERHRQGQPPKFGTRFDNGITEYTYSDDGHDEGYDLDGEYTVPSPSWDNTPSRTRTAREPNPTRTLKKGVVNSAVRHAVTEEPPSPPLPTKRKPLSAIGPTEITELPLNQHINRFKVGKAADGDDLAAPSKEIHSSVHAPQEHSSNMPQPAFSSKVSSYNESSSEEDQPHRLDAPNSTPSLKRSHQDCDLDFDRRTLETKSITDLDAIPFATDPSAAPPEPAVDANGNQMTVSAKLTNLTKMRPEDQRQFFKSQTDEEREQTASWFLDKFRSDMQKLMAVRLERRKTALKFELEVKKHERRVQLKKADVDRELEGLRKGGVELISGRAAAK